jgi:xanthine/uracil/vitamin C permease (AzgA family)
VPNAATAPILILVGTIMLAESHHIDWQVRAPSHPPYATDSAATIIALILAKMLFV